AGGWRSSRDFKRQQISGSVLFGSRRRLGLARTARQREGLAVIERADAVLVEARFLNLQIGAIQRIRGQLFDRETDSFRRGAETAIREASPLLLADGSGKQFGGSVEVERTHRTHGRGPLVFFRLSSEGDLGGGIPQPTAPYPSFPAPNIGFFHRNATPIALQY